MAVIDNLVAYYSLGEASGDALDAHASKTATENNGAIASTTGKVGNARDFEQGSTQFFQRTDSDFLQTGDFTIQAWVKPEALAGNTGGYGAGILSHMSSETAGDWWLAVDSTGAVAFAHFATGGANAAGLHFTDASSLLADATWAHIVARRSSGTYTIWVDGVSRAFSNISTASGWGTLGFSIGRQYTSGGYLWDGLIDEAAVWSAAKSDADIAWLYNSGAGRSYADIVAEGSSGNRRRRLLLCGR
jgi:hypothetical protein